jgi:hypothetical protein
MDRKETIEFSLICCLLLPGAAFASSSASYDLDWNVVGVGGGTVYSSNYSMQSTVGQPVIGHSKLNYDLGSGFWYGIMAFSNLVSPIAICGPDKLKCENVGSPVQFNGSASYDPDGVIVSYAWEFGDGTNGTGVAPLHKYSTYRWNGTAYKPFTVNLTVTDNDGMTDSTSRKVVIWIAGDANGDGKINILDASNIGLKWGSSDPCADLNNDGKVTIMDASIIGLNWGRIA